MTNKYEAPNPYASGLATLRAAAAGPESLASNDARTIAALKMVEASTALKQFAIDFSANQIARIEIEYEHAAEFDRRTAEAAERLGCTVAELRIASDDDDGTSYAPPKPYTAALKSLKEHR